MQTKLPHLAANIKTGAIRQAHIKDNQVRVVLAGVSNAFGAVILPSYLETISFQSCGWYLVSCLYGPASG